MKRIINNPLFFYLPLFTLMFYSLLNMYNARYISLLYQSIFIKQLSWFITGIIIIIILKKINIELLFNYSHYLYLISIILLVFVLLFGSNINGAKAWLKLGIISFQPSELMKLSLTLYLIKIVDNYKTTNIKNDLLLILKVFIITIIPSILVFLEPDTGAIIFFTIIALSILYLSGIKKWWFIIISLLFILATTSLIILYIFNQNLLINILGSSIFYRIERIVTFQTDNSYQLKNALIAIGSTTILGNGFNNIKIYIPEAPTDFIFAFNTSNFGLLSCFLVLASYILINIYLIHKYNYISNKKIKLFLSSFINIFFIGEIINICMTIGLLPIIGIPLPFLSYGGSTIIIYFIYLGIILKYTNNNMVP